MVHQIKAVAERRGWQHKSRVHLHDAVMQLGEEHGDPQPYLDQMARASDAHRAFHENHLDTKHLRLIQERVAQLVEALEKDLLQGHVGRSYTIKSRDDQHRIARLLGLRLSGKPEIRQAQLDKALPIGTTSDIGFSPAGGYKPPHIPRDLS